MNTAANDRCDPTDSADPTPTTKGRRTKLGIALIGLSGVLWFSLFLLPFLPTNVALKTTIGAFLFGGVQLAWWFGAGLVGPDVLKKLRLRKRPTSDSSSNSSSPREA